MDNSTLDMQEIQLEFDFKKADRPENTEKTENPAAKTYYKAEYIKKDLFEE